MDFDFSDDQEQLREACVRWVSKGYDFARYRSIVAGGGFSRQAYGEMAELGLCGLFVPEAHGGMGMGPVEAMEAGWQGDQSGSGAFSGFPGGDVACAPLASTYFNLRKTTIYGGSNEIQRNIVSQTVLG